MRNVEPLSIFVFFLHWRVKGFSSRLIALKEDVSQDRKMYCLQACPCSFQPGNFAGDYSAVGVLESREYRYNYSCHCKALRTHLEMRSSTSVHKIIIILTIHKQASFSCSHAHSNECRQLRYINARFLCQKLRMSFCCE